MIDCDDSEKAHFLFYNSARMILRGNREGIERLLKAIKLFKDANTGNELVSSLVVYFEALSKFSQEPVSEYEVLFEEYKKEGVKSIYSFLSNKE